MYYGDWGWKPYVPVAERRRKAAKEMAKRQKQGQSVSPVRIEGRAIATTFWGKAWCDNLECYSDFANRLPRGRTYVRNGSVVDLQITAGAIRAVVCGSELYDVVVKVAPVAKAHWTALCSDCGGAIESLVELLQGRLSKGVMERICHRKQGLFPLPSEIKLSCSCPDGAYMCKHVAAVLYGIGARLDHQPEMLFQLRGVDEKELIAKAGEMLPLRKQGPAKGKVLGGQDLGDIFGLDMAQEDAKPKRAMTGAKKKAPAKVMVKPKAVAKANKTKKGKAAAKRAPK